MQRGILFGDLGLEFNHLLLVGKPADAEVLAAQAGVSGDEIHHAFRMVFYEALRKGRWSLAWGISLFSTYNALQRHQLNKSGQKIAHGFVLNSTSGLQMIAVGEHLQMFRAFTPDHQMDLRSAYAIFLDHRQGNNSTQALKVLINADVKKMCETLLVLERLLLKQLTRASGQRLFGEYERYATELGLATEPA